MSEKEFLVTYTSRSVVVVKGRDVEAAKRRAMAVLTGGVMMPAKMGVVIEDAEAL